MKKKMHITTFLFLVATGMMIFLPVQSTRAQDKDDNYGKTPSEMLPYGNYQDAYIYHFHEPQLFLGAGREKKAPPGLTILHPAVIATSPARAPLRAIDNAGRL